MGNSGSAPAGPGDSRQVEFLLHSVHNVEHAPNESYYGMVTNHTADAEQSVTSDRPARLTVGLESIVSVRIYLHASRMPASSDRAVGQISIPIREMLELCGPGMYQTWLLLDSWTAYGAQSRTQVADRFRRAMTEVGQELHSSRICVTMLEASVDPAEWIDDAKADIRKERALYHDPLLVSHSQVLQTAQAYLDYTERLGSSEAARDSRKKNSTSGPAGSPGAVEASSLRERLERLQRRQTGEEVSQLHRELDLVTEEANQRIEQGNEEIIRLKADLKRLREIEGPELEREKAAAEVRLEAARSRGNELRKLAEGHTAGTGTGPLSSEVQRLREEVEMLKSKKAELMEEVQDVYSDQTASKPAKTQLQNKEVEEKLLPEPSEFFSGHKY
eukprot:TRINITY_DN3741_c7_g1_i1.p1 TRINITY_DN3741_c7_g1~~TRINITY_DN3741_c7_g1_i1.p1  ORF type:complete len:389 (+),score=80.80 TRINITY_DN3741_c7_g1_i1:52-1218(+)